MEQDTIEVLKVLFPRKSSDIPKIVKIKEACLKDFRREAFLLSPCIGSNFVVLAEFLTSD